MVVENEPNNVIGVFTGDEDGNGGAGISDEKCVYVSLDDFLLGLLEEEGETFEVTRGQREPVFGNKRTTGFRDLLDWERG